MDSPGRHLEFVHMVERMKKKSLLTFSPLHLVCKAVVSEKLQKLLDAVSVQIQLPTNSMFGVSDSVCPKFEIRKV